MRHNLNPYEQIILDAIVSLSVDATRVYHDEIKAKVGEGCPAHKYSGLISSLARKGYIESGRGPKKRCYCRVRL